MMIQIHAFSMLRAIRLRKIRDETFASALMDCSILNLREAFSTEQDEHSPDPCKTMSDPPWVTA
jgi:hypothetical protein